MQGDQRPFAKVERQRLISSVVTRKRIGSQRELLEALAAAGCRVTQATVSRDIRELGLEKTRDALGTPRYTIASAVRRRTEPREALQRVLGEFGRRATAAQNIVVVESELGSAPTIGRALDRLQHPKIIGTLAGDDTCLVIAGNASDANTVAAELRDALP